MSMKKKRKPKEEKKKSFKIVVFIHSLPHKYISIMLYIK